MAKSSKKPNATKPSAPVVVVNHNGLTPQEAEAALRIQKSAPAQVEAIREFQTTFAKAKGYFWSMVDKLRQPVSVLGPDGKPLPAVRLNGREITLLLRSEGMVKTRVSEVKAICELDDDNYALALRGQISKEDALKVARGSAVLSLTDGEEPQVEVKTVKREGAAAGTSSNDPKYHRASKAFISGVADLMNDVDMKPQPDGLPYEFSGETADGRRYSVRVFVDQKPTK